MARKRRGKEHKERIHEQMLQHLDEHPLPTTPEPASRRDQPRKPPSRKPSKASSPPAPEPRRPRLMLRKMPLELALESLERFVRIWRHQGVQEVIVVVGKGIGSAGGEPVIAPAVRDWLTEHPEQIAKHEEAPVRDGGSGAILVHLLP